MKLTPRQKEIIKLMAEGWQLGSSTSINSRAWLQFGGCGKGGKTKNIRSDTPYHLRRKGIIEIDKENYRLSTYKLTAEGQKEAKG